MKINVSWALGFKLCTVLYAVGLIGAVLLPSHEQPPTEAVRERHMTDPLPASSPTPNVPAASEPMTRAVLDGIYFDVVRATGKETNWRSRCARTIQDRTGMSLSDAPRASLNRLFSPPFSTSKVESGTPTRSASRM